MKKKHLKIINIVMTITFTIILWQTVSIFINHTEINKSKNFPEKTSKNKPTESNSVEQNKEKSLFGSFINKNNQKTGDYILKGTITANTKLSAAIIELANDKEQKLYHLGDMLPDGSTIKEIKRQYITLNTTANQTRHIWINKHKLGYKDKDAIKQISSRSWEVKRDTIDSNLNDINALLKEVRIIPHFKNNEADGFRLKKIKSTSFISQIGIKNNDIIKAINDIEIKSPLQAIKALTSFMANETDQIKIKVERNNREINLQYKIN